MPLPNMRNAKNPVSTERHFGLGARTNVDIEVEFGPSGRIASLRAPDADSVIEIREDGDTAFADGFES